jgi:hypothetical protein
MEGRSWRGRHGFRPPKCSDRRAADLILPFDTVCHFRSQSQSNLAKAGLQKVLYFQQFSNDNQIRSNGAKGRFMTLDQKVGGSSPSGCTTLSTTYEHTQYTKTLE